MNKKVGSRRKMKVVDVIVAPRAFSAAILSRGVTKTGEFGLLDPPANLGFKCWVKGRLGIWEHGKTETEAVEKMKITLPCWRMTLGNIIHQEECTD